MRLILNVYKQIPTPSKKPIAGTLDCDRQGTMRLWDSDGRIAMELREASIKFIGKHGFAFKGYEPDGVDKRGVEKFKYQEWWCCPIRLDEK